jgi:formimidoylglutamate deiminase
MGSDVDTTGFFAPAALLPGGWATDVSIYIDGTGEISRIRSNHFDPSLESVSGPLIPGMINVHSHAFQRAITGRTQSFASPDDDFWSWRDAMYLLSASMTPADLEQVAVQLYRAMLRCGYTSVCEFHYLHHDQRGLPYDDPAEMSRAIIRAAEQTGIGLTLLPVLYTRGGIRDQPLSPGQMRFAHTTQSYLDVLDELFDSTSVTIGYAPHSIRAVGQEDLHVILDHRRQGPSPEAPVHIHISEQRAEVETCLQVSGARPIDLLYDIAKPDENWCLIHATHASDTELWRIVESGTCVGLCPTTEADLGDGVFPLLDFMVDGGRIGIGSDSNICVSPGEEIRLLEFVQRLQTERRNTFTEATELGAGTVRYRQALEGGRQASGRKVGRIEAGSCADFVVLKSDHALIENRTPDESLNAHVFSGGEPTVSDVIVSGKKLTTV